MLYFWLLHLDSSTHKIKRLVSLSKKRKLKLELVTPAQFEIASSVSGNQLFFNGQPVEKLPDGVIQIVHNFKDAPFAIDILQQLKALGVPCLNSLEATQIANDKYRTAQELARNRIPVPITLFIRFPVDSYEFIESQIEYPIIIKPTNSLQGKGVLLCHNRAELKNIVQLLEVTKEPSSRVIVQQYIHDPQSSYIRVVVLDGKALGAFERLGKFCPDKHKIPREKQTKKHLLTVEIANLAIQATKALGLDFAGVDILTDGTDYYVCEVNANPGLGLFERLTGVDAVGALLQFFVESVSLDQVLVADSRVIQV